MIGLRLMKQTSISIHAPLTGCDPLTAPPFPPLIRFQSTHPLRDATFQCLYFLLLKYQYFNPRTPYGMRQLLWFIVDEAIKISIHAPLTGCDFACAFDGACACCISIHAPLTGCDAF